MAAASFLLAIICLLGAFDIAYFHHHRCRLSQRAESRNEAWVHVVRGVIYTLQLVLVPNVRFTAPGTSPSWRSSWPNRRGDGRVLIEPASRRSQGGLPAAST